MGHSESKEISNFSDRKDDNQDEAVFDPGSPSTSKSNTMVVVNEGAPADEENPLVTRLNSLKLSHPILWDADNFPWTKRQLPRTVDANAMVKIVRQYEDLVHAHSQALASKQNDLSRRIKEIDYDVAQMYKVYSIRQRQFAKHVENMYKVNDLIRTLSKCQVAFNESLMTIDLLNDMLPEEERLEPFTCEDKNSTSIESSSNQP